MTIRAQSIYMRQCGESVADVQRQRSVPFVIERSVHDTVSSCAGGAGGALLLLKFTKTACRAVLRRRTGAFYFALFKNGLSFAYHEHLLASTWHASYLQQQKQDSSFPVPLDETEFR